jgi:hypothetical protein
MAIQSGSKVGADFNNASDTAQFAVGDTALGTQDTLWVYIECNGAVSTGDVCVITTGGTATRCVTSGGQQSDGQVLCFPQTSATSGQFVWAAQRGKPIYVQVSATCNPSAALYVATASGKLSTTSASSTIGGVVLLAVSGTATNAAVLANVVWPKWLITTNGVG